VQIYVEIERARLTKRLAKIKEASGDVDEAADTLQEVAVVSTGQPVMHVDCWNSSLLSMNAALRRIYLLMTHDLGVDGCGFSNLVS
jgi:hypothetical protein